MSCKFVCDGCGREVPAVPRYLAPQPPLQWSAHLTRQGVLHACSAECVDRLRAQWSAEAEERARVAAEMPA